MTRAAPAILLCLGMAVALLFACSSPDPGTGNLGPPPGSTTAQDAATTGGGQDGGGNPVADSGALATEGGADAGAVATDGAGDAADASLE